MITVRLIGNFKEIDADRTVSSSFSVHGFMTSFSSVWRPWLGAWCNLPQKWCKWVGTTLGSLCTHRLVPHCPYLAAARGVTWTYSFPLIFCKKAAQCTPVADYLFDFHSQGLITVRSSTASSPWMSVGSCFSDCSDVFWHSL